MAVPWSCILKIHQFWDFASGCDLVVTYMYNHTHFNGPHASLGLILTHNLSQLCAQLRSKAALTQTISYLLSVTHYSFWGSFFGLILNNLEKISLW